MSEIERLQATVADFEAEKAGFLEVNTRNEALEAALGSQLKAVTADLHVPKHVLDLLEGKSTLERLNYLNEHRKEFASPGMPAIDAGAKGKKQGRSKLTKDEIQEKAVIYGVDPKYWPES